MKTNLPVKNFTIFGIKSLMAKVMVCSTLPALLLLVAFNACAQSNFFNFSVFQGQAQFSFQSNNFDYYVLKQTPALGSPFSPILIAFGSNGPVYQTPATNSQQFFVGSSISIYSPQDTLGDGIDDVFKLENGLNPLDPTLAGSNSGYLDANGNPLTWLQYYNQTFGRNIATNEAYGREYSVFNLGLPTANFEAFSKEVSVYNGQSPPLVAIPQEVYSRELSVFNFTQPTADYEAISKEVSVYNGQSPPLVVSPQEVYSREVSVFSQTFTSDAVSREISVFNSGQGHRRLRGHFTRSITFQQHHQLTIDHTKPL